MAAGPGWAVRLRRAAGWGVACALLWEGTFPAWAQDFPQPPAAQSPAPPPGQAPPADPTRPAPPPAPEDWTFHFQATVVSQGHPGFSADYSGINSLSNKSENAQSLTTTLFLGRRLWEGAALYFDPEVAGGTGMSSTLGVAGFPNGETTRVTLIKPTPYIARLFLEQTFDLGGAAVPVNPGPNQLGGTESDTRLTLRGGKLSATDIFDTNKYSHDPRGQFMNWSLMDNGAWDYPADTRGYTGGVTAELVVKDWALRYGFFLMPKEANGTPLDFHFLEAHGQALEFEEDYRLGERPGIARLMVYLNDANMGSYRKTIDTPAYDMDITLSRGPIRSKGGVTLNAEQELSDLWGAFFRAGWSDGRNETFAFTEIDRTVEAGVVLKGAPWDRPGDVVGAAFVVNGLSNDHEAYLAKGGHGFIIGDGRLSYGPEAIFETYYSLNFKDTLFVTFDFQFVDHPAYNRDRGPVPVWAIRVHVEF